MPSRAPSLIAGRCGALAGREAGAKPGRACVTVVRFTALGVAFAPFGGGWPKTRRASTGRRDFREGELRANGPAVFAKEASCLFITPPRHGLPRGASPRQSGVAQVVADRGPSASAKTRTLPFDGSGYVAREGKLSSDKEAAFTL